MMSPVDAGPMSVRISVSVSDDPTKLFDPSVLYPHVLTASAAGVALADVGRTSPRLFISVLPLERKYSL